MGNTDWAYGTNMQLPENGVEATHPVGYWLGQMRLMAQNALAAVPAGSEAPAGLQGAYNALDACDKSHSQAPATGYPPPAGTPPPPAAWPDCQTVTQHMAFVTSAWTSCHADGGPNWPQVASAMAHSPTGAEPLGWLANTMTVTNDAGDSQVATVREVLGALLAQITVYEMQHSGQQQPVPPDMTASKAAATACMDHLANPPSGEAGAWPNCTSLADHSNYVHGAWQTALGAGGGLGSDIDWGRIKDQLEHSGQGGDEPDVFNV